MDCPTEFQCAVFADGELGPTESRQIAEHIETCRMCESLVSALRRESLLLVQSFQAVEVTEPVFVPELEQAPLSGSALRFGLGIAAVATALRMSFDFVFGFQLPPAIAWLDPRHLSFRPGVAMNGLFYAVNAINDGGALVAYTLQTLSIAALAALLLAGLLRARGKGLVTSATFVAMLCLVGFSADANAIDVRKGAASNVPAGTTVDDTLIVFGDSINVDGTVNGDLIAVGRQVTISGTVTGDVITAAERVIISGSVGGSIFGAGDTVETKGTVARNIYSAGDTVVIDRGSQVAGNAFVFSSSVVVDGRIGKDLVTFTESLDARGEVVRNILFRGSQVSLLEPAKVGGNLSAHVAKSEAIHIDPGVVIGGTRDIQISTPQPSRYLTIRFYLWQMIRLAAAFVTGLALLWLFPALASAASVVGREWLKSGSIGFMAVVVIPVAAIVIGITLIGLPLALTAFVLWIAGLYVSKIVVAQFMGRAILKDGRVLPLLVGLIVVLVAVNLPYIGGLINALLMFLGFGALMLIAYRWFNTPASGLTV